jgi:hypothetical protein
MKLVPNRADDDARAIEADANALLRRFITEYAVWRERGEGTPAVVALCATLDPAEDARLSWARWLRVEHADPFVVSDAMRLVQGMVRQGGIRPDMAAQMEAVVREPRPWDDLQYWQRDREA